MKTWMPFCKVRDVFLLGKGRPDLWPLLFEGLESGTVEATAQTAPPVTTQALLNDAADPAPDWWRRWRDANIPPKDLPLEWTVWFEQEIALNADHVRAICENDRDVREARAERTRQYEANREARRREALETRRKFSLESPDKGESDIATEDKIAPKAKLRASKSEVTEAIRREIRAGATQRAVEAKLRALVPGKTVMMSREDARAIYRREYPEITDQPLFPGPRRKRP